LIDSNQRDGADRKKLRGFTQKPVVIEILMACSSSRHVMVDSEIEMKTMNIQSDFFQAIIFDLDGTLLYTLADIAGSVNRTLARYHFPEHPIDAYKYFIGNGWKMLVTRALPEDRRSEPVIAECVTQSRKVYQDNWNRQTRLYEGIPDLLDKLTERKLPLAVLSNKPHDYMLRCVDWYLNKWKFKALMGQSENFPLKPDPASALEVAGQIGLPPSAFLFIGDSAVDIQTAEAAGMHSVGVTWGFRGPQELKEAGCRTLVHHPQDILSLL
jgi:phosphoglycolate phosphatase